MARIAVIGNAGGGKSTFSRALAKSLNLPYHEFDSLQWTEDWQQRPLPDILEAQEKILSQERWILDGFGPWESVEQRFAACDRIVLLDLPLWVHFWLVHKRQAAWEAGDQTHKPAGHSTPPDSKPLFEMIAKIDEVHMPKLREMIQAQEAGGKAVECITTLEELDQRLSALS